MKNNLEEVWREEFECTYKTKDNEIGWIYYLQARKKAQDELEFWKNEYVSHSETMCRCQEELQKTREHLNTCEKLLMRFVPDEKTIQWQQRELDAKQYFKDKDKQGEG